MSACIVPLCPALAVAGEKCALHQQAMTAKQTGVVDRACTICHWKFHKEDYVMFGAVEKVGRQQTLEIAGYRHVACEPIEKRPTRQELKDAPKPLWDETA